VANAEGAFCPSVVYPDQEIVGMVQAVMAHLVSMYFGKPTSLGLYCAATTVRDPS
jgi:hypothetical protein